MAGDAPTVASSRNGLIWNPSGSCSDSWWYVYWTLPVTPSLYGNWRIDILRNYVVIAQQFFTYDATPNQLP